jgi:hypothetical protein
MAVHNRNWSHIMQTQTPGAFAPTILPTSINWNCCCEIVLEYERISAKELVSSGLLSPDEIPENRSKQSRNGALRVHIAKGGTYNARIDADELLSSDAGFKRFLGGLLADSRLSLIKGESHV